MDKEKLNNYHVLLVDDETDILDALADTIEDIGPVPLRAKTISEANHFLEQYSNSLILVLSDLKMPEMDGLEFRKSIMESYSAIPFAIVSGFVTKELALQALDYKVAAFLDKPVSETELSLFIDDKCVERIESIEEEKELLAGFVDDANELIEDLEESILALEEEPGNYDAINNIFRIIHTIKGASGFFKPSYVHEFAHAYEDFLTKIKNGEYEANSHNINVLLQGFDSLKNLIQLLTKSDSEAPSLDELCKIFVSNSAGESKLDEAKGSQKHASIATNQAQQKAREDLKVPIKLLDDFMSLSGELTVFRNMIDKTVHAIEQKLPGNKDLSHLNELLEEMHKVNGLMQNKLTEVRKVPVLTVLKPIPRILRDLSSNLKKEIEFSMSGEQTRIDTILADVLNNSLVHMIRNAADHGLESTEDRIAAGKPEKGSISVKVIEQTENIAVEISDDGKGLNAEIIREKIVEKKLVSVEEAAQMSEAKVHSMIFEPGFSTASQVTDVSGRGVGMDMVKSSIEKIGGHIDIDSKLGQGTKFTLNLPVPKSVLIIDSLLIRISGCSYCLPRDTIVRVYNVNDFNRKDIIRELEGAQVVLYDGELVPLVSMQNLFNEADSSDEEKPIRDIIVLQGKSSLYAIEVDEILDIEDTVVKSLDPYLQTTKIYGGATFLGDGSVGLILDVDAIANKLGLTYDFLAKKKQVKDKNLTVEQEYIVFSLGRKENFCVPRQEIFRLEQIKPSQIQFSGKQAVIPYRDKVLPLFFVSDALAFSKESFSALKSLQNLSMLVVEDRGRMFGFIANEIVDIQKTSEKLHDTVRDRVGIAGNICLNDQTITVIDLKALAYMRSGIYQNSTSSDAQAA